MIDLNVLRENTDQVKKSLKNRGFELDVDFFQQLEQQRKDIQIKTQDIQQERNSLSKQIGILKAKGEDTEKIMQQVASISTRTKDYEIQLQDIQQQLNDF
ncbi:MAG: Serine--tRNA ligase, partial [Pseudomonadota bacterium]